MYVYRYSMCMCIYLVYSISLCVQQLFFYFLLDATLVIRPTDCNFVLALRILLTFCFASFIRIIFCMLSALLFLFKIFPVSLFDGNVRVNSCSSCDLTRFNVRPFFSSAFCCRAFFDTAYFDVFDWLRLSLLGDEQSELFELPPLPLF